MKRASATHRDINSRQLVVVRFPVVCCFFFFLAAKSRRSDANRVRLPQDQHQVSLADADSSDDSDSNLPAAAALRTHGDGCPERFTRRRLMVFVVGGITLAEAAAAQTMSQSSDHEIVVGGTSVIAPAELLRDMRGLTAGLQATTEGEGAEDGAGSIRPAPPEPPKRSKK